MPGDKATPNPPSDTTVPLELKPLWENDPNTADWAPRDPDPDEPIPSTAATGTTATGPAATGATATTPTASSSLKHKASPKKEAGYSSTSNKIGGEDKVIKDDKGVDHFGRTFETDLQKKHDEETNKIVPRKLVLLSDGK